jgi:hypothetical protein
MPPQKQEALLVHRCKRPCVHAGSPHWPLRISTSNCLHHLFWPQIMAGA